MKKNILKIMLITACLGTAFPASAFAYTVDEMYEFPDESTRADITVNISRPEAFEGTIEFFCGNESFDRKLTAGETNTSITYNVPKGQNQIEFFVKDDIYDGYVLTYENYLDTDTTDSIDLTIEYSPEFSSYSEDELDAPDSVGGSIEIPPAVYDYSDGKESGTVIVSCTGYGSFNDVMYRLTGTEKVYDIVLDAEHGFTANVTLPVDEYRESNTIKVTPSDLATITDDISFAWAHRNNESYYGNNYEVKTGETTYINDLFIRMNYQGDMREVDDTILLAYKLNQQYTDLKNERRDEFMEEKFGEKPTIAVATETETPVIAEAAESEQENFFMAHLPYMIAMGAVLGVIGYFVGKKMKKKEED